MTDSDPTREAELRDLLTNALEVQLAAFKAGIAFWEDWITQASRYVRVASDNLSSISASKEASDEGILRVIDAGRENVRSMLDLPRSTASRFIEELDNLAGRRHAGESGRDSKNQQTGSASHAVTPHRRAAKVKE